MTHLIHPTALIHPSARLGEGVHVGAYAVIEDEVEIGAGTQVGAHAVVKRYTRVGAENRIHEHAVIGGDPQDFKFKPCRSAIVTGRGTVMRKGVTVHLCRVGTLALLAASARINQDCLPFIITDGVPGRARALNLVGLRRAGMSASELSALKSAFHALRSCKSQTALLAAIDGSSCAAVAELASFIRGSRRGYAHVER